MLSRNIVVAGNEIQKSVGEIFLGFKRQKSGTKQIHDFAIRDLSSLYCGILRIYQATSDQQPQGSNCRVQETDAAMQQY